MKAFGVILVIVGFFMMIYSGFSYETKDKVVDLGKVEIAQKQNHFVQWPPIMGAVLCVGGIVILATAKEQKIA